MTFSSCSIPSGLQGVNADWLLCYVPQWTLIGIVGVVVFNPQAPESHCLPFRGQEGTQLEMYVTIQLNTDSCFHR